MSWSFATTSWDMLWHMWLLIRLQKLFLKVYGKDTSQSPEHQPSSWVTEEPTLKAASSVSCVSSWASRKWELCHITTRLMDKWSEPTKCWCKWLENWVKIRRQPGPSTYQNWYMLTNPQDWPSLDTACTIRCLDNDHAYQLTFIFPPSWAQKTPACQSLCCWLMWATVHSLQGGSSTVHIWGWKAEVILWSLISCHFTGARQPGLG